MATALARYRHAPYRSGPVSLVRAHHRRAGGGVAYSSTRGLMGAVVAGLVMGWLDKQDFSLPTLPLIGKPGTLAVICHLFKGKSQWFADGEKAFSAIAAYELAKDGTISGIVSQT